MKARHMKSMPLCLGYLKGSVLRLVVIAKPQEKGPRAIGVTTEAGPEATPKMTQEGVWLN